MLDVKFIKKDVYDNLDKINKIRNCLVHLNGDVSEFKYAQDIKNFSKTKNDLISISNNSISIKFKFLKFIVDVNGKILKEVRLEIDSLRAKA